MTSEFKRYQRRLVDYTRGTRKLFGNAGKEEKEKTQVHGFLNVVGVKHTWTQLESPEQASRVDVKFKEAQFQTVESLDEGRKRGDEFKQREEFYGKAKNYEDLLEPVNFSSVPFKQDELVELVVEAAAKKKKAYEKRGGLPICELDLLVYVEKKERHAFLKKPFGKVPLLTGWRSVSVVAEMFGAVLHAADDAPTFLKERLGKAFIWPGVGSIFQDDVSRKRARRRTTR